MDTSATASTIDISTRLDPATRVTEPRTTSTASNSSPSTTEHFTATTSTSSLAMIPPTPESPSSSESKAQPADIAAALKEPRITDFVTVKRFKDSSCLIMRCQNPGSEYTTIYTDVDERSHEFTTQERIKTRRNTTAGTGPRLLQTPTLLEDMSNQDFRNRVQDLPRELFDEIQTLAFAFDFTSEGRCIDRINYKPPMQLHINKDIRAKFLPQYYGIDEEWIFVSRSCDDFQFAEVQPWLDSLSPEAFAAVHRPFNGLVGTVTSARYGIAGKDGESRCTNWRDICSTRSALQNESSCWAWSPGPDEFGRWATRFTG